MDNEGRIDAILFDFPKDFDLVLHDRLLIKIAICGVDSRVVPWVREFLLGRTQRVSLGGQLSQEVRVTSGVPQRSVLGPLLFLAYVNYIWRNIGSTISLFADDYVIHTQNIINNEDIEILQKSLERLGEWAAENDMKMNPSKCKAVRSTRARVKDLLNYTLGDQLIPEASSSK
jgi:hypothetical protein